MASNLFENSNTSLSGDAIAQRYGTVLYRYVCVRIRISKTRSGKFATRALRAPDNAERGLSLARWAG